MCGIFGWITQQPRKDGQPLLERSTQGLQHRGPDGEGYFLETFGDFETAFGHRRLSIIDLSAGAQPMSSHDSALTITFNGEIYNYVELRQELVAKGHKFETASDTEVILEAYRAWGTDCLKRLRGMFAFALLDKTKRNVLLARDAFGKKPLFLSKIPGGVVFSSEIGPLLEFPGVGRAINHRVISSYLVSRFVNGPETFFENVRKLQPGRFAIWANGSLTEDVYFVAPFATTRPERMSFDEAVRAFGECLDTSVKLRMRSDAAYGAYLSGGLDSSVITTLMAKNSTNPIKTYAVGFKERGYSELPFAREVADAVGAHHHELIVSGQDFADNWERAVQFRGAPISQTSDIPILILSQWAGKSVKMVLTGEGADELLGGYPKYRAEAWVERYQRIVPEWMHRAIVSKIIQALPTQFGRVRVLDSALAERDSDLRKIGWFASSSIQDTRMLTRPEFIYDLSVGTAPRSVPMSRSRQLRLYDQLYWLPDNLLERGDRMMMAGGIEGRMPFMDTELAGLIARIPDGYVVGSHGKRILREAARGQVSETVLNRSKIGFSVPMGSWLRTTMRSLLFDLLTGTDSWVKHLLDGAEIERLIRQHAAGTLDHERILWTIANLELFLRIYKPSL
ncbi:asparagine synthase (glutamine-hydrolyzing) [Bradyrhizobium guangzhouense]|uniref:asparagine synthase (glutamine-hydrolyzing) n=1 Tax=Bradyrhizobium guangzhouense TaxID=1325095 RepID=A0ABY0E2J4_9BRAD|nr:asparagine synthase (glutamine-hydrolyzing) [Bradyrhizobium guangzhouense]RXH09181.1 asparagine synthase (glutamine-hydrolyzing) [Bradyrhizobium guangzhouense]